MTRKDYVMLAAALKLARTQFPKERPDAVLQSEDDAHAIAHVLADDNPRFDRERFLKAAGLMERTARPKDWGGIGEPS